MKAIRIYQGRSVAMETYMSEDRTYVTVESRVLGFYMLGTLHVGMHILRTLIKFSHITLFRNFVPDGKVELSSMRHMTVGMYNFAPLAALKCPQGLA